jgi:hypothetical protein
VREAGDAEFAPAALDKGPLIDACLGFFLRRGWICPGYPFARFALNVLWSNCLPRCHTAINRDLWLGRASDLLEAFVDGARWALTTEIAGAGQDTMHIACALSAPLESQMPPVSTSRERG